MEYSLPQRVDEFHRTVDRFRSSVNHTVHVDQKTTDISTLFKRTNKFRARSEHPTAHTGCLTIERLFSRGRLKKP